jgi:hypothetical protein
MDDRDWTFVIRVDALYLTEAVGREFRIDRVTFIDRDKLARVRRKKRERLGLGRSRILSVYHEGAGAPSGI